MPNFNVLKFGTGMAKLGTNYLFCLIFVLLIAGTKSCRHNGITYRNGDEWVSAHFILISLLLI